MFGYEPGAFTGATHAKPGKFHLCNGGTILLDEIAEIPTTLQAKLLQVLQDQKFFRLGGKTTESVDVRILAATNVKVEEAIKKGKFRLDLFYRLSAFSIEVPPLRRRKDDIPVLLKHFNRQIAARYGVQNVPMSNEVLAACMAHTWPGNVRELQNFVKRYVVLGDVAMPNEVSSSNSRLPHVSLRIEDDRDLKHILKGLKRDAEVQVISEALREMNWNRRDAAALLNLSYKALVYKIREYGLHRPPDARVGSSS